MTRKSRRLLRSCYFALLTSSFLGMGIGLWLHLPAWFFFVLGLFFSAGLFLYPEHKHQHKDETIV